jgi:outer membrane protein assembly factor BamA
VLAYFCSISYLPSVLKSSLRIFSVFLLTVIVMGCSIQRNIPKGAYLVGKVKIKGAPPEYSDDIYSLLKEKPNKKFLGVRLNMWFYIYGKNVFAKKQDKLKKDLWEEPVLIDSGQIQTSATQINAFLFNKGYFNNTITYTIRKNYIPLRNRIRNVIYHITTGNRYTINNLRYNIPDPRVKRIFYSYIDESLVKAGMPYDGDLLSQERDRITMLMRNNGYLNFSREYVYYDIDSTLNGDIVNVGIGILNPSKSKTHKLFRVRKVFVEPNYLLGDSLAKDTITNSGLQYIERDTVIKPNILSDFIFYEPGEIFETRDYQSTINRINQLGVFKFIDIQYLQDTLTNKDTGFVDVLIRLSPGYKQAYQYLLELNTREETQLSLPNNRTLGTAVSFQYQHMNIARSALQLSVMPRLSFEVPISHIGTGKRILDSPTVEYGATASLTFPKLLTPFRLSDSLARMRTSTSLNFTYLREQNRNYTRTTLNLNLAYQIKRPQALHFFTPVELSLINAYVISSALQQYVDSSHDPLILNFFDPHIIGDMRYTLLYHQQPFTLVNHTYIHFRNSLETGGNLLTAFDIIADNKPDQKRGTGKIFGVQYYQYAREEADLRLYVPIWHYSNIAFRQVLGLGLPYFNSTILPYERRFLIGGTNSIRAWQLGKLGPGTYAGNSFDHSGDLKLESSAELRFPIYGIFKGALFLDGGNVWTYKNDPSRPGSQFFADSFYKQFALGSGVGFRFDFSLFVVRLDLGGPLRDPTRPSGQRYVIESIDKKGWLINNINWNLGVGYPF